MPSDEMQRLWLSQPVEAAPMELERIRRKGKLHGKIRGSNLRESIIGLLAVAWFIWFGRSAHDPLDRLACGLLIAAMLYVIWHL